MDQATTTLKRPIAAEPINLQVIDPIRSAIKAGHLKTVRKMTLGGNEAIAIAAMEVGAKFYSGYPITPSTEVLEVSAAQMFQYGGTYLQMEDEIAGIAAAIGASLGGTKSFTATSGPGFSLKQENLGYACLVEAPLVVVNVQRGGPSTGGPTVPGQSDVMQARWGTHGDHPIIAITPNSVQECYEETIRAFNLSEKYRVPVIMLTDAKVSQMKEPVLAPPLEQIPVYDRVKPTGAAPNYEPFGLTPNGVPPMAAFGESYRTHYTGLYHSRDGLPTLNPKMIDEQLTRIHAKLETPQAMADIIKSELFCCDDAEQVVVAFGITSRAAKDAVISARQQGIKAGMLRPITMWPSDEASIKTVLDTLQKSKGIKRIFVAELNLGQYIQEIQRVAYLHAVQTNTVPVAIIPINRIDTNLITPENILRELLS